MLVLSGQSFANYDAAQTFVQANKAAFEGIIVYRDAGQGAVKVVYDNSTATTTGEIAVATLENLTLVGQLDSLTTANFSLI